MNMRAPVIAVEPQDHGHQRRAGLHGERSRAAHHAGLLSEELHLHAPAGDIAVTDQADSLARPQPLRQDAERAAHPPAGRQHLHAETLAERDEPVIDRLRLQPLRHDGNRAGPLGDQPRGSHVVVAQVRQGEDHPAAGRGVVEYGPDMPSDVHPSEQPPPASPAAGMPRASSARTSAAPAWTARAVAAWRPAPDHPAQVALEHPHPGAVPPPREVGEEPEGTLRPRFGQAADNRPAEAVSGIGEPVLQPWHRCLPRSATCCAGLRSNAITISRSRAPPHSHATE